MGNVKISSLVSIVVITYNSSKTVLDTLNSIKKQTYRELELVISDDNSDDVTLDLCKGWITDNRSRFVNCKVVIADINTGTSANCNRGIKACNGKWIRIIAGDDLMTDRSIEWQMEYLNENPDAQILIGERIEFKIINGSINKRNVKQVIDLAPNFFKYNAEEQYNYILRHYEMPLTSGTIINNDVYQKVSIYNEKYSIIEDLPFWLAVTKAGIKYHYIDKPVVLYRIHESITHANNGFLANRRFCDVRRTIIKEMIVPNIKWNEFILREHLIIEDLRYWLTFILFKNKKSLISIIVLKMIGLLNLRRYFSK